MPLLHLTNLGPSGERLQMAAVPIMTPGNQPGLVIRDVVHESFAGAWQRDLAVARTEGCTAFSTVYACISLISGDIAKLRPKLVELTADGIWQETSTASHSPVLRKPNRFQTRIQFLQYWVSSKLIYGNAYILKERDNRNVVTGLYPLDPRCVRTKVTDEGDVFYEVRADNLAGIQETIVLPARDIIHDRMNTLFHPLCGVPPIYACAMTVTQGQRIQNSSARFFENMSRPSGLLIAPGNIQKEEAERLSGEVHRLISGVNLGKLLLVQNGMKYEAMNSIPAEQAQLIEQLEWTGKNVAAAFLMPLHKIGLGNPTVNNAAQYNLQYYQDCVQKHIEDIEELLDDGLGLGPRFGNQYGVELDLEGLLRMDDSALADRNAKEVGAGYLTPNEARRRANLAPVDGGDTPYLQQQYFSLEALAERDSKDPFAKPEPAPQPQPTEEESAEIEARALIDTIREGLKHAV